MLSNVLKSSRAIDVSVRIIDIFVKLRESLANQTELWLEIERIKSTLNKQDKNIDVIFRYLDELVEKSTATIPLKRIGYKPEE